MFGCTYGYKVLWKTEWKLKYFIKTGIYGRNSKPSLWKRYQEKLT